MLVAGDITGCASSPTGTSAAPETTSTSVDGINRVPMPQVEGMPLDEAEKVLTQSGLSVKRYLDSNEAQIEPVADWVVSKQLPTDGRFVHAGSDIFLSIQNPEADETSSSVDSTFSGKTTLTMADKESDQYGYTLAVTWAFENPRSSSVTQAEATKLKHSDLSLPLSGEFSFENTTPGQNRTINLAGGDSIDIAAIYSKDSPVCKYGENVGTEGKCALDLGFSAVLDFDGGSATTSITGANLQPGDDVSIDADLELALSDVPDEEVKDLSKTLLDYESLVVYVHMNEHGYATTCDAKAVQDLDYSSLYLPVGTPEQELCQ